MQNISSHNERILTPELKSRVDQAEQICNIRCTHEISNIISRLTTLAVVGMAIEGPTSDTNLFAKKTIL